MADQSVVYDGFISYSHAADDLLAPRLQAGLQRFAKPWWKRRAVRIFRDEASLAANPHLWSSITEALDTSGWFVLLLSPEASTSEWVGREIEHWKQHSDPSRILPVVTDGEFGWADGDVTGSSVPAALQGVFTEEPRWVDLRFARGDDQLDLKNPTFSAAIADVASAIRGVPKDELEGEEVRQHRRTIRTAWAAGVVVLLLGVAATIGAVVALNESDRANEQADLAANEADRANDEAERANSLADQEAQARSEADANAARADANAEEAESSSEAAIQSAALAKARELAASAINLVDEDPERSILLALEGIAATPEGQVQPDEVIDALWNAVQQDRLIEVIDTGYGDGTSVALSPDESTLFVVNGFPAVVGDPNTLAVQAYTTSTLHESSWWVGEGLGPQRQRRARPGCRVGAILSHWYQHQHVVGDSRGLRGD